MSQYYYLISSLPTLRIDLTQFPELESFVDACKAWLDPEDLSVLENTRLEPSEPGLPGNTIIQRWQEFEYALRNELVRLRAARLHSSGDEYLRRDAQGQEYRLYGYVADSLRSAFAEESPDKADLALDRQRWSKTDEFALGHYFDLEALQVYYLRLQILHRRARFTRELGEEQFNSQHRKLSSKIAAADRTLEEWSEHGYS